MTYFLVFLLYFFAPPSVLAEKKSSQQEILTPLTALLPPEQQVSLENYLKDANILQKAQQDWAKGKKNSAIAKWKKLANFSLFSDIALFRLAQIEADKKNPRAALKLLEKLKLEHPFSSYQTQNDELLLELQVENALLLAKHAKTSIEKRNAVDKLHTSLSAIAWKDWIEYEHAIKKLVAISKEIKHPLANSFIAEVLLALPSNSEYYAELSKQLGAEEIKRLSNLAKFRSTPSQAGVKAINLDQQLFESGMEKILEEKWKDALEIFQKVQADFPQSEHLERAQYWEAACLESTGKEEKAKEKYELIFQQYPFSYYGIQAAEKIKIDWNTFLKIPEEKPLKNLEGVLLPLQQIYLWRAIALISVGMENFASKELEALYNYRPQGILFGQNNPELALQIARLYYKGNFYFGAFMHTYNALMLDSALTNKSTVALLFPRAYSSELQKFSQETGISDDVLLSIIKQESGFRADVSSRANALGLMQLLPSTGREIIAGTPKKDFFLPETNIKLGSTYFKKLLDRFDNNIAVALAGYNAGPSRAAQWIKKLQESPVMKNGFRADIFIDTIPFTETRKYVGNILRNLKFYSLLKEK